MTTPSSTLPAFVILPPNLPGDTTGGVGSGSALTVTDPPPIHASDLKPADWRDVLNNSGVYRAWKGERTDERMHIQRAPRAALKDDKPEFVVYDESFTDTQQSDTTLAREMTLMAFTESGIHATLSGGANGLTGGLGGSFHRKKDINSRNDEKKGITTVHGFYNFPRVVIFLEPETLQLSESCKAFLEKTKDNADKDEVLQKFFARFGGIIATRTTLGGRLCTSRDAKTNEKADISQARTEVLKELTATLTTPAGGMDVGGKRSKVDASTTQQSIGNTISRMMVQTQGGNALLAANIPDWTTSVESYRYWRVIQQTQPEEILDFLMEVAEDTNHADMLKALCDHVFKKKAHEIEKLGDRSSLTVNLRSEEVNPATGFRFFFTLSLSQHDIVESVQAVIKMVTDTGEYHESEERVFIFDAPSREKFTWTCDMHAGPGFKDGTRTGEDLQQKMVADLRQIPPNPKTYDACHIALTIVLRETCSFAVEESAGPAHSATKEVRSRTWIPNAFRQPDHGDFSPYRHASHKFPLDRSPGIEKALLEGKAP